ncbi:trans-sulfuration enzyme family protein [Pectinatus haikarae]|uniref:Cystathionine gamma-synthase n=1 Tax=Pectinatus haikarae TaxID=349096 RepID=A0ABT9Y7A7_9FIRM|nr:PLP-dependent aspartate aminotransferase family protein [Pectinatus haikarae]MDQ0203604.1 cystathionine gamma-synthase [Pectinatus haikarae]
MDLESKIVHIGINSDEKTGAISTPIYNTASFAHPALGKSTGFDYTRSKNPTRQVAEDGLALLENGSDGFAFSSGMAAATAVLMLYKPGDHIILTDDCYGGTYRLFSQIFINYGISFSIADTSSQQSVMSAIKENTKAIFIETPTNPMMKITDIASLAAICQKRGIQLIVDNTFLTPYFQRPIELGADIVLHSGTKYLAGHNDLLCGIVVTREKTIGEKIRFIQNATGNILSPSDSWLLIRGLKTLGLRMEKHNENAKKIAYWLNGQPHIEHVYYPGLEDHPGREIHNKQASGCGGIISFAVDNPDLVPRILSSVKFIQFAESLGGVESLITFPSCQTHTDIPEEIRHKLGITDKLLRLSVGIENYQDIISDLEQALE